MNASLKVGNGDPIAARSGETLLELDNRVGIDVDFSCRGGNCGMCLVRVVSGHEFLSVPSPCEEALIPDLVDEPAADLRLACQLRLVGPVHIEPFPR